MVSYIEPQTTADVVFAVQEDALPRDDATVIATVFSPKGVKLVNSLPVPSDGPGLGTYTLTWLPAWTESAGKAVEGEYLIELKVTRGGRERRRRFRIPVRFDDVD